MATVRPILYTHDARSLLDEFLRVISEKLQLPPYRYQLADQRYGTINRLLETAGSPFAAYTPRIYPAGLDGPGNNC
jgi:hypothetical protein